MGRVGPRPHRPAASLSENTRGDRAQTGRAGSLMNTERCHTISTGNSSLSPLYSMQVLSALENVESGASGQSQQCLAPQPARWGQILRGPPMLQSRKAVVAANTTPQWWGEASGAGCQIRCGDPLV